MKIYIHIKIYNILIRNTYRSPAFAIQHHRHPKVQKQSKKHKGYRGSVSSGVARR